MCVYTADIYESRSDRSDHIYQEITPLRTGGKMFTAGKKLSRHRQVFSSDSLIGTSESARRRHHLCPAADVLKN